MELLQRTAALPGGSGRWIFCYMLPHRLGGSGQCNSSNALPHCLGAVDNVTPAMHCRNAWGQWAGELLHCTAPPPGCSGQWNSINALPHCPGGSALMEFHCPLPPGSEAVHCRICTTLILPHCLGGSAQCNSSNALPYCLGAVDNVTPPMHCRTAWGQWAVVPLQRTGSLPGETGRWSSCNALPYCLGGSGQWNSCNTPPHSLGVVGGGTPAMHRRTAWGQRAVEFVQRTASLPGGSRQLGMLPSPRTGHTGLGGRGV